MTAIEIICVMSLGVLLGVFISNTVNDKQERRQLDEAFYQLVSQQKGKISLIQLAATAKVEAKKAQAYLEQQAVVFGAFLDLDEDNNSYYRFPELPAFYIDDKW